MGAKWISYLVLEAVGGFVRCNPTCEDILEVSWCFWPCSNAFRCGTSDPSLREMGGKCAGHPKCQLTVTSLAVPVLGAASLHQDTSPVLKQQEDQGCSFSYPAWTSAASAGTRRGQRGSKSRGRWSCASLWLLLPMVDLWLGSWPRLPE